MTPLRRSTRTPKPVIKWIPPQPTHQKLSETADSNSAASPESDSDDEKIEDTPPASPLVNLPIEVLQSILSFAVKHPNQLIRMTRLCSAFHQSVKTHPLWRELLVEWEIPFKEPVRLNRDYHQKWRYAVLKAAKEDCESCDRHAFAMGRNSAQEFRRRLCKGCFVAEFSAFKVDHAAAYARYARAELTQKESTALVGKAILSATVHHTTTHSRSTYRYKGRGHYTYATYHFPKDEVMMLRDFVKPVDWKL
ncbi:hypothetical protein HDU98_005842 [Podochytrium sp. JEL0797]|nr:hypothetical protein HDU98_005842 [Podochytrium sp. JEL0797]